MEYILLEKKWFDVASEKDLNRIIVCFDDGQGDHCVYTYKDIFNLLLDMKNGEDINNMTPLEIIDSFYTELNLNGNNTHALYFDNEYKIIRWN